MRRENSAIGEGMSSHEESPLLPSTYPSTPPVEKKTTEWYKYWDINKNLAQVFVRERNPDLFAIDAFRAMGFLWIVNSHLQEGLANYYPNFNHWVSVTLSKAIGTSSAEGVTIFFVISGFLNIMVTQGITRRNKEPHLSLRGTATFMFRRCCHLPPNLYVIIIIALIFGCTSHDDFSYATFCTPCITGWWTDLVFLNNFSGYIGVPDSCFNSTWTVSAQMQLYITSLPVFFAYSVKKSYGYAACAAFTIIPLLLRMLLIMYSSVDGSFNYTWTIYLPFYTRADAYGLGMALYMIYNDYLKGRHVNDDCASLYTRLTTATWTQLAESSVLWILALWSIYAGMYNIFSTEEPFWLDLVFHTNVADQYESYSMFVVAACALGLAFVALEGTLWPVAWFFQMYVWYPIASLSYTGYLFSMMVSYEYAGIRLAMNDGVTASWTGDVWDYVLIYCEVIVVVLLLALGLSMAVEKPFLNIARDTNF